MKYAIRYIHGSNMLNSDGVIFRFDTKSDRDVWVADGSPYVGPDEREALPASHRFVKRAKEYHQEGLQWPIQVAT
jgi:hypothetical protein